MKDTYQGLQYNDVIVTNVCYPVTVTNDRHSSYLSSVYCLLTAGSSQDRH